jgi:hypothetical protein
MLAIVLYFVELFCYCFLLLYRGLYFTKVVTRIFTFCCFCFCLCLHFAAVLSDFNGLVLLIGYTEISDLVFCYISVSSCSWKYYMFLRPVDPVYVLSNFWRIWACRFYHGVWTWGLLFHFPVPMRTMNEFWMVFTSVIV